MIMYARALYRSFKVKWKSFYVTGGTTRKMFCATIFILHILLTKTTAARNESALSYLRGRGLCFPAVVFVATIDLVPAQVGKNAR